ncbi:protocatechuate 3,4-dioxygenase subunit alpha [Aliiroseovarius sp. PTFE2010]|uniref:protocatechuate 3,4-dioxygenase subunit alpha n=1 Tax=Aliiroseovarius sp. PTFE2010 TaxID=3417190 RepID=UPI003CEBB461
MVQSLENLFETPSQTAGPYVHLGCIPTFAGHPDIYGKDVGQSPIEDGAQGTLIEISGSVYDGLGWALRDAMIESWQADANGRFAGQDGADPKVPGFCRFAADQQTGAFTLRTIKPGKVPIRGGGFQAPHISLWIVGRGINIGLNTRLYFEDEDNTRDPLLSRIEQKTRIATLIAKPDGDGKYRFDIHLKGSDETVFLDL